MNTKPKTAPVRLLYDVWTEDGRLTAGSVVDLPVESAKALIAVGKADRADPMPGDE